MPDSSSSTDTSEIGLSEMIENLRKELEASLDMGRGRPVAFEIDKVELELNVTVTRKRQGETGVAFWVVKAGGSLEAENERAHKFNLTLLPVSGVTGERIKVQSQSAVAPSQTEARTPGG
jgi:hypothetical protein